MISPEIFIEGVAQNACESEPDALRAVEVRRQFIEQVVLLCGEIGLIEVIADDERLKRHTLKLCVDCAVRANFSESDGQCRHAVEPVERRADCDGNCCICASGQPEMGASASLLLRHIYDCTSTTCS